MIRNAAFRKSCRRRLTLFTIFVLAGLDVQAADAANTPVKVFILSGQSNMVGAGKVDGGSSRWGAEFIDPVVSVYKGAYDPKADYDVLEPVRALKLGKFGGSHPPPIQVVELR